jgi:hypothetical protein
MNIKYTFIAIIFLSCITINAQKNDKTVSIKPISIYTVSSFSNDENSFFAINKKLKLSNFNFVIVDGLDLDLNRFSLNSKNLGKKPSTFIYDDFKRYQDRNLLKGFLLKNDPTRWNLQCLQPNIQL